MNNGDQRGNGDRRARPTLLDNNVISRKEDNVRYTNFKAIVAGKNLEIYEYKKPICVGKKPKRKKKLLTDEEILDLLTYPEKYFEAKEKRREEYKRRNRVKAVNAIRRLTQMNFEQVGKFLTLTFRDTDKFDIHAIKDCLPKVQTFIKKFRKIFPNLRFICVPEFQDKNGRGAVHFHLVMDIPYIGVEKIRKLWKYGFVKINVAKNPLSIGLYMAKYLGKSFQDPRYDNHRRYYASKNLIKPSVKYGNHIGQRQTQLHAQGYSPGYITQYKSDWHGQITYSSYNLYTNLPKKDTHE